MNLNYKSIFCIIDTETTHLNLLTTKIWQISYSLMQNRKILEEHDYHVWQDNLEMSADAARVTRFDFNKYKSLAVPSREVALKFAEVLYNPNIFLVFHNGWGFDLAVIKNWLISEGLWRGWLDIPRRVIDTMCLLRMHNNDEKPDLGNFIGCQLKQIGKPPRGAKKSSLGAGCKEFGIEYDSSSAHDSAYDIRKTGELCNALLYKFDMI